MQSRVKLINGDENWNEKKRYKINAVVNYLGSIYQNKTGINSEPSLGNDWIIVKKLDIVPLVFHQDFYADITQEFTIPEGILIENVFINFVSAAGADWSQSGTTVTVTSSIVGDFITLTGRN